MHWRAFLEGLRKRGLEVTKLITSDDYAGLRAARRAVFPNLPWQCCHFYLQQNAQAHDLEDRCLLTRGRGRIVKAEISAESVRAGVQANAAGCRIFRFTAVPFSRSIPHRDRAVSTAFVR